MRQNEMIKIAECEYAHRERAFEPLLSFAKIVAAKEREACAKLCETLWDYPRNGMATEEEAYGKKCATAIRARGQA